MTDATSLLISAASDHSAPGALERAERALERGTLKVGDYYWVGDECLVVTEVDANHSTHSESVVKAEHVYFVEYGERGWMWGCPGCGCTMRLPGESIPLRHDPFCPRCPECACPPTQRDGGGT